MNPSVSPSQLPPAPDVTDTVQEVAKGGPGTWSKSYTHPTHGELTFTATLPTALQITQHSVRMDNLLAELGGPGRGQTMVLAAALAGMADSLLMQMPEVDRIEEPDDERGSVKVTIVRYDPMSETNVPWLTDVWMDFSEWRGEILTPKTVEAMGKS